MSYIYVIVQSVLIVVIGITSKPISNPLVIGGFALGLALMVWSLKTMRLSNLNIMPDLREKSVLVTSGPYRWIRHPMYSAVLLMTLMMVLTDLTVVRCLYWIVLLLDLGFKFRYEESLLLKKHPEYAMYRKRTKMLIPFVF
jgi:protein-S-isoprenylcysteine O-methyltransferase Ste14